MKKNACCSETAEKETQKEKGCGCDTANTCGCDTANTEANTCGCDTANIPGGGEKWMDGSICTAVGEIARVSCKWTAADIWGAWKARFGWDRMDYKIAPGLYCAGNPDADSPVLVTANYKLTFDHVRRAVKGLHIWILVLDTKGVNVWCAAGKGTFGTKELVERIAATDLKRVVAHRTLIVPQLGATGVAAHEVRAQSGFKVEFGPVRVKDCKAYLDAGMKASKEMRQVHFTTLDRLVLTPMEIVNAMKSTIIIFGILFILNAIGFGHYGWVDLYAYLGAILTGGVIVPLLLPWIPGRAFSLKGFLLGLVWAAGVGFMNGWPGDPTYGWPKAIAYLLILPAVSAYLAMNFTGASTYTSPSGVNKEMRRALPLMLAATAAGIVCLLANDIVLLVKG